MRVTSETSCQPSLWDTDRSTSSQESACGRSHCDSPACQTKLRSGPPPAHANLSARQASEAGLLTSGTSGLRHSTSSGTAGPESSWESRLRHLTDSLGSTLYSLTWKRRVTPQGRSICALRASVRRIFDSGYIGWPTPDASIAQDGETLETWETRRGTLKEKHGNGNGCGMPLTMAAALTGWPTPTAKENAGGEYSDPERAIARAMGPHANDLRDFVHLAGWQTPKVQTVEYQYDGGDKTKIRLNLDGELKLSGWATPSARDWKDTPGMAIEATNPDGSDRSRVDQLPRQATMTGWPTPATDNFRSRSGERKNEMGMDQIVRTLNLPPGPARRTASGETLTGSSAAMPSGGRLSPAHSLWLMLGPFATAWACCAERVTRSTSRRRRRSSKRTET